MPSAYAELLEAVENTAGAEWLHAHGTMAGQDVEMWLSLRPLRTFVRKGDHVEAADTDAHREYKYDPLTNTLTIRYIPEAPPELREAPNFMAAVMAQLERAQKAGQIQITTNREVVRGTEYGVYTLTLPEGNRQATLTVDTSTQRLVRMESEEAQGPRGPGPYEIEFDYPGSGPVDVYAVGVPRDAKIVDKMPNMGILDLYQNVEQARERFAPTYYAVIYTGRLRPDGRRDNLEWLHIVYKKDGRYRIERYGLAVGIIPVDVPPDDLAALQSWSASRPVQEVCFGGPLPESPGVRIQLASDGSLDKHTLKSKFLPPHMVEDHTWSSPLSRKYAAMIEPKDGPDGQLLGTGCTGQGLVRDGDIVRFPYSGHRFWNPQRDYAQEQIERVSDVRAPWQEDKDWLKDADPEKIRKRWLSAASRIDDYRAIRTERIVEYGHTTLGQWYAKKILKESTSSTSDRPSRTMVFIHLDTERDIPDELLDPDSVSPEAFQPKGEPPSAE